MDDRTSHDGAAVEGVQKAAAMRDTRDVLRDVPHPMGSGDTWFESERNYPWYAQVIGALRPRRYVEFGAHLGFSLISALEGAGTITEVAWADAQTYIPDSNRLCSENLRAYLGRTQRTVEFQFAGSVEDIQQLSQGNDLLRAFQSADVLLVDGDHRYEAAVRDMHFARALGTRIMLVDDCLSGGDPHLRHAVAEFSGSEALPYCVVPTFNGLAIFDLANPTAGGMSVTAERIGRAGLPVSQLEPGQTA